VPTWAMSAGAIKKLTKLPMAFGIINTTSAIAAAENITFWILFMR